MILSDGPFGLWGLVVDWNHFITKNQALLTNGDASTQTLWPFVALMAPNWLTLDLACAVTAIL